VNTLTERSVSLWSTDTLLDADERNGTQLVTASGIERLIALLPTKRPKRAYTVVIDNVLLLLTGLLETNGA
jgi:hypothetical protein